MKLTHEEKLSDDRWYLKMKEVYLLFLAKLVKDIENGDAEAARIYQELEDTWTDVQNWYREQKKKHN